MKPILEIHPIQAKVLKVLLFQTEAKFSELNQDRISTDRFNFHLKALLEAGVLEKIKNGKYVLTPQGKEFANRFDTEKIAIERQAKITLVVVPVKTIGKKKYYLSQQRLKQPYFGYFGFVGGKIRWGEKIFDAAKRELLEETGLLAKKTTLVGINHKTDYSGSGELLEDKFFFRVRVDQFSGELKKEVSGGRNYWFTKKEILKQKNVFPDMEEGLAVYDQNDIIFTEKSYVAEGY